MPGPLRNTISIVDAEHHTGRPESKNILSVGFAPDVFIFSLLDVSDFRYVALEEYRLDNANELKHYTSQLRELIRGNELFKKQFERINIAYYSGQLVLVPGELYNDEDTDVWLDFCTSGRQQGQVRSDRLYVLNAFGIYSVPHEVIAFFEEMLPGYRLRHHGAALIENTVAIRQLDGWQADMVLHINPKHFEILLFQQEKLSCYQSFQIQCLDDMLYYIFYVLEQYGLQASRLEAMVLGRLSLDSRGFELLSSFFKKVRFPGKNDMYKYSQEFEQMPHHYFFNIFNLNTCG